MSMATNGIYESRNQNSRLQLEFLNARWQNKEELLNLAAYLYERGFTVIPLLPRQKSPTFVWREFRSRRPSWTELQQIFENAVQVYGIDINIGTITGKEHNFVVVDVDDMEAWRQFERAARLSLDLIPVWMVKTGRGFHIYFKHPEGVVLPYKGKAKGGIKGVELLGDGHIVVLPPSVHSSGILYQWHETYNPVNISSVGELVSVYLSLFDLTGVNNNHETEETEDAEIDDALPEWLQSIADTLLPHWREGVRHNLSLAIVGLLRKRHIPKSVASAFIRQMVEATGDDELKDRLRVVDDTYAKTVAEVAGYQLLVAIVGKETADTIVSMLPTTPTERRISIQVSYDYTDVRNAEIVLAYYGDKIIYTKERGFYYFDGKKFVNDRKGEYIRNWIINAIAMEMQKVVSSDLPTDEKDKQLKWLRQSLQTRRLDACLDCLKGFTMTPYNALDADGWLINLQNGVLNLQTMELYPHMPDFLMTKIANASFNPDADCPRFMAFLNEILEGRKDMMEFLQRIAGYTLLGFADEEVTFFLYGTGANGKTTFLNILKGVLGDYAKTVASDVLLPASRRRSVHPEVFADLYRLRMAVIEEWSETSPISSEALKSVASKGEISARHLFGERFTFKPTHKLFVSTNNMPKLKDITEGAYRRLCIIPFTYFVPADKQDKTLDKKILQTERDGILNWMLEGLQRYLAIGLKEVPEPVQSLTVAFRSTTDVVNEWLERRCVVDKNATTKVSDLYADFVAYMKGEGVDEREIMSLRKFSEILSAKGYPTFHTKTGKIKRGIRLRDGLPPTANDTPRLVDTEEALGDVLETDDEYESDDAFIF